MRNSSSGKIKVCFELDPTDLAEAMVSELDNDRLFATIVAMDDMAMDWELTLRLCDHFAKLKEMADEGQE